jgi:segregation and condensation protein B
MDDVAREAGREADNGNGHSDGTAAAEPVSEPAVSSSTENDSSSTENEVGSHMPPADDFDRVVEAVLFASREPLTIERLAKVLGGAPRARIQAALRRITEDYETTGRPFSIVEVAGGFEILTGPEFAPWLSRLVRSRGDERLSRSSLETLAIIAYKQPITRAEIEAIRGVHTSPALKVLLEKNLVKIAGRAEILGRPMLYATTREFLDHFGLKSVKDLPRRSELLAS